MIRAHRRIDEGTATLSVRLGFDDRHRRRLAVTADTGERVLIDLAAAERLRGGDLLQLDDGRIIVIEAADEAVADIAADTLTLTRIAWHLGNRHTPTAVLPKTLRIRRDHVLEAMVERLGGTVARLSAPFDPEVGAYHGTAEHGHAHHVHSHHHDRDPEHGDVETSGEPDHRHGRDHGQTHAHRHEHGHARDPLHDRGQGRDHGEAGAREHAHAHRVAAAGDGAGGAPPAVPAATTLSNADERDG